MMIWENPDTGQKRAVFPLISNDRGETLLIDKSANWIISSDNDIYTVNDDPWVWTRKMRRNAMTFIFLGFETEDLISWALGH
jgi:hypothetical protein